MMDLRLKTIQRDVCGRVAFEKSPHLVKWSSICKYKKLGGLVIRVFPLLIKPCLESGVRKGVLLEISYCGKILEKNLEDDAFLQEGRVVILGCGRQQDEVGNPLSLDVFGWQ